MKVMPVHIRVLVLAVSASLLIGFLIQKLFNENLYRWLLTGALFACFLHFSSNRSNSGNPDKK